jgi:integrase
MSRMRCCAICPRHLVDPVLFAVNTGCREQEVCGLRWDWEIAVPELDTTVFVLPDSETKTRTERVIVLNSIARRIVDARRASADASGYVFSYRGKRLGTLRTSAWRRAWTRAGLPEDPQVMKGVHNLRHTCGRRLRAAASRWRRVSSYWATPVAISPPTTPPQNWESC